MPVYVTPTIWTRCIVWTHTAKIDTNPDRRIFELLQSCFEGMGRALATADDRVAFTFKHWFWQRCKPKAKKQLKAKLGARLCLHPETEEPWLLIFDIDQDSTNDLKKGEKPDGRTEEDRGTDPEAGEVGLGDSAGVDSEG